MHLLGVSSSGFGVVQKSIDPWRPWQDRIHTGPGAEAARDPQPDPHYGRDVGLTAQPCGVPLGEAVGSGDWGVEGVVVAGLPPAPPFPLLRGLPPLFPLPLPLPPAPGLAPPVPWLFGSWLGARLGSRFGSVAAPVGVRGVTGPLEGPEADTPLEGAAGGVPGEGRGPGSFCRATPETQGPIPGRPDGSEPRQVATAVVTVRPQTTGLGLPVAAVAATAPPAPSRQAATRLAAILVEAAAAVERNERDPRPRANRW